MSSANVHNVVVVNVDASFKELAHPSFCEFLKLHNAASFKLVKTGMLFNRVEDSSTCQRSRLVWNPN